MEFEWNPDKAGANFKKHGVPFTEGSTVFGDPLSITFPDPAHSINESRYITIGLSRNGKLLILAHKDRNKRLRIISAREATRKEKRFYEQGS